MSQTVVVVVPACRGHCGDALIDRRAFLGALAFLTAPLVAEAQQAGRQPRIGFLWTGSPPNEARDAFRQGLREANYIDGQNVAIEHRSAADDVRRLSDLAEAFVRDGVDVIVTQGTPAANAAKRATATIPIVMAISGDPVGTGLVASLARPGGNITGLSLGSALIGKRLQILKEAVPNARRFALLTDSVNPEFTRRNRAEVHAAARSVGRPIHVVEVGGHADFERAFKSVVDAHADALVVSSSPILRFHRKALVDLSAKFRLPTIYQLREFVESGGLMAYGPRDADLFRRAAAYVAKILRGAKPADLPVEEPTTFELVFNLKTAKALGLTISPSLLQRADEVIE
jgi:putative tryptophan/tyrosine transport system substrate-binding protein